MSLWKIKLAKLEKSLKSHHCSENWWLSKEDIFSIYISYLSLMCCNPVEKNNDKQEKGNIWYEIHEQIKYHLHVTKEWTYVKYWLLLALNTPEIHRCQEHLSNCNSMSYISHVEGMMIHTLWCGIVINETFSFFLTLNKKNEFRDVLKWNSR